MRKIIFFFLSISIVYFFSIINNTLNYKNTEWKENSPTLLSISSNSATFMFCVTEPASVYWRIYTNDITLITVEELTNTNSIHSAVRFGGNITRGQPESYTTIISNLSPNTIYYFYAIAVSFIGTFPKEIRKINFQTLPNK